MPIYDISVPVAESQTPIYPGDPGIDITSASAIADGDPANISHLSFGAHTGTHIDAPKHFIPDGRKVIDLSFDTLVGRARVVKIPDEVQAITAEHVGAEIVRGATRVLFKTRNSAFWRKETNEFQKDYAYLAHDAARSLVAQGVQLVGIDYLSIEAMNTEDFPTHKTLLGEGIVIIEGLDLSEVAAGEYELFCLPLKLAGGHGDGAPARTILRTVD